MGFLVSCSTLPVPQESPQGKASTEARAVLENSAKAHGNPWQKYREVKVGYDGEWSTIATRVQPVITNPEFRKSSVEVYQPRLSQVRQTHSGPQGSKQVRRTGREIDVKFNGTRSSDPEVKDAAALVADAYTVFLFGSSWLQEHARNLRLLDDRNLSGEKCRLVVGSLSPGFGNSAKDHFVAWISAETGYLRRFQFSLNGMESTRGADVDVVFSKFWEAPDGSKWPAHFLENIQRPILVKAHEWRMTELSLDGRNVSKSISR